MDDEDRPDEFHTIPRELNANAASDRHDFYILDEHDNPAPAPDHMTWARWKHFNRLRCGVSTTTLPDGTWISTIFLGKNLWWHPEGPPLIYETLVFPHDLFERLKRGERWRGERSWELIRRYSTPYEARLGHVAVVKLVMELKGVEASGGDVVAAAERA